MDDKIEKLVNAGLKVDQSPKILEQLNTLTDDEVTALIGICKKLSPEDSEQSLIYSFWPTRQPIHSKF